MSAFYYLTIPWALPVAHICITGVPLFSRDNGNFCDCDYDYHSHNEEDEDEDKHEHEDEPLNH